MALKYYGLYKQATEGPCRIPKPGFWDVVSRAKYEAWNALGDMDSFEAKKVYVEELKKVSCISSIYLTYYVLYVDLIFR